MKPRTRKKLFAASKAGLLGALLAGGVTLFVFFGDNFLGWTSGAGISFPDLIVAFMPYRATELLGLQIVISNQFIVLTNSFIAGSVFFAVKLYWEFTFNGEDVA